MDLLLHNLRTIGTHHCDQTVGEEAAEEIERLRAEVEMLRQGDTCARQCEGTAYRIVARQMRAVLADWMQYAADIQCGDACGQDWLDGLRQKTTSYLSPNA